MFYMCGGAGSPKVRVAEMGVTPKLTIVSSFFRLIFESVILDPVQNCFGKRSFITAKLVVPDGRLIDVGSRISWKENKMFCNLTKCTMPMYLFHQQLIYLSIVLLNGRVSPCTNAIVNFAFAFIVSYILSRVVLHYKYTRILIGEKKLSED